MLKPYNTAWASPEGVVTHTTVMAHRFSHYVDGIRFWFLAHQLTLGTWAVTHQASGRRVLQFGSTITAAHAGASIPVIARSQIDRMTSEKGAAKVRAALVKAEAKR